MTGSHSHRSAVIQPGRADDLGATWDGEGVNFAVYSARAESVELCLFDGRGGQTLRVDLPGQSDGVWHGYLPGCSPGQRYGYRAHGEYSPEKGLRFNPQKLLVDPYARELAGGVTWQPAVFDYDPKHRRMRLVASVEDSAPCVPKSVVQGASIAASTRCRIPWGETLIYETNVRGYTMRHPAVGELDRGTFRGMCNRKVLEYLKSLGVTSVELMPVQSFVDEEFLVAKGLGNFWGYNTLGFFAPDRRLLGGGHLAEFKEMVNAIHDMNIEVILDVVFNHTAEGGKLGPTFSFRGIDNRSYYRLAADDAGEYVNDTGCGNTVDTEQPVVRRLIRDCLAYWVGEMGVDGFRFDLASILGRTYTGFDRDHPFFAALREEPLLADVKLIAEPWDIGPGGYRLGGFPADWAEWNDRFRDASRRFWRADPGVAPELARRVHGSADLFEASGRQPHASINFVTSHDGFTLADCVSYLHRHNEANGEANRDGHVENHSLNYGIEGPTDDPETRARRRRHRLNLLTTLLFSQGTPMLLAGDEFGNSQNGNNNAYCQDNATGWLDWSGLEQDPEFTDTVRGLIRLRRELPLLRQTEYRHGQSDETGLADIAWFDPTGAAMTEDAWNAAQSLGLMLAATRGSGRPAHGGGIHAVAILFNASKHDVLFTLPKLEFPGTWLEKYSTDGFSMGSTASYVVAEVAARTTACLALVS